ncbi:MAG: hypothetical protein TREMPRED_005684 [Tremellales sp. Tagirdzhanova-0007]|nr:MAG: hypothetical protein TREMPRED_005684 [Tremellales sp. Tagirdzhanova-0007]
MADRSHISTDTQYEWVCGVITGLISKEDSDEGEHAQVEESDEESEAGDPPDRTQAWQFTQMEPVDTRPYDTGIIDRCMPNFAPSPEGSTAMIQRFDHATVWTEDPSTDTSFVFFPENPQPERDGFRVTRIELTEPLDESRRVSKSESIEGYEQHDIGMDIWSAGPQSHKREQAVFGRLHISQEWLERRKRGGQSAEDLMIRVELLDKGNKVMETILDNESVTLQRDVWQLSSKSEEEEAGILNAGLPVAVQLYQLPQVEGHLQTFLASGYHKSAQHG